jgi:CTP:molybdopterin cytidylyltransferase MocA
MIDHRNQSPHVDRSAFTGYRFPPEVIMLAVRWYLRYGLSYRDVEELLLERGIEVDHVTIHRWVQRFTPLLIDAIAGRRVHLVAATQAEEEMLHSVRCGLAAMPKESAAAIVALGDQPGITADVVEIIRRSQETAERLVWRT